MKYEFTTTDTFDNWLQNLSSDRARIADRILRIENGNFGDFKNIEGALYELRFFLGGGYRVYFTIIPKLLQDTRLQRRRQIQPEKRHS